MKKEIAAQLTFRNGQFIFRDLTLPQTRALFSDDLRDDWVKINPDDYATSNPKAAVRFRHWADDIAERVFARAFVRPYRVPTLPPLSFLDEHQRFGINWILSRSRSYLAHAPGAGKTAQAILAGFFADGNGKVLFVVPPSLTENWRREINLWVSKVSVMTPAIETVPLSAKKDEMNWSAKFIICPDSMLAKEWVAVHLRQWKYSLIAVDEASRLKELSSDRSKAFYGGEFAGRRFAPLFRCARHTVFLDGSPMPNRPMELYAPLSQLTPETIDFMSEHEFGMRYCAGRFETESYKQTWVYDGSSHENELQRKIQEFFMDVVTEDKLGHPERRRSILHMTKDVRTAKMKKWEQTNIKSETLKNVSEDLSTGALASYRKELGLKKVDWISNYVRDRLENTNEKLIVFIWHRDVAQLLAEKLKRYVPGLIIGGVDKAYRENVFRVFNSTETKGNRLIIGNISAMGRGHNLQATSRVIFGEYSWSDELNKQCEKRASRKGSTKAFVRCEYIVAPNSLDEIILKAIFKKAKTVKKVMG